MIRVNVLYPNSEDLRFDMEYYLSKHIPLVQEKLGSAVKGFTIDRGLSSSSPGEPAPFFVVASLTFESIDSFQQVFGPNADHLMADLQNFTSVQPIIQISEVKAESAQPQAVAAT